ncbi:MAG: diguanylate cyclase [Rhodospirillales bacterium]|nr:diguanylate cyclase [Rhodospirillales bacterium]
MDIKNIDPQELLNSLQAGVVVHSPTTEILYANPMSLEILRLTENQVIGKDALDPNWRMLDNHHKPLTTEQYPVNRVLREKRAINNVEIGVCDSSSEEVTWVLCNAYPEWTEDKTISQVVVTFIDVTHDHIDIPYKDIVDLSNDVIVVTKATPITDPGPEIVYVNNAFTDLTGYTPEEAIGKDPRFLQGDDTSVEVRDRIRESLAAEEPTREEILNYSKRGQPYWLDMNIVPLRNEFGEVTYFAAIERDVTEAKKLEQELKDLALTDPLTGLYNRRGFDELGRNSLSTAKRNKQPVCIAMLDIDYFKKINDEYGHNVGDTVLEDLALCLKGHFRENDLIGRLGGEEFAVILYGTEIKSAYNKLEELRKDIEARSVKGPKEIKYTVSIGFCKVVEYKRLNEALKKSDKALYKAKDAGRNQVVEI